MKFLVLAISGVLLGGCAYYKTPKYHSSEGKYPAFARKDSLIGSNGPFRSCFDVHFYELDIKLDPKKKNVGGSVTILFSILTKTSRIQLDLSDRLAISSVVNKEGRQLNFEREYDSFFIELDREVSVGEMYEVKVCYDGSPKKAKKPPWKGGLVWKKKYGKDWCGVACEDDGAHIWWPLKDLISDKPDSVRCSFTIPTGLKCVSNGRLISEQRVDDKHNRFTWQTSYPINPYNVTFYIGDFIRFELPYNGKYTPFSIEFYVLHEHFAKAREHFKQVEKIIYDYEELFGPYPWPKDGYKLVESPFEGMEHQSAIAYGNGFKNVKYGNYDYIILHETAHEWWGNSLTCCDMADLWLHEGFATYAEMLYEEKEEASWLYLGSYGSNRWYIKNKRPIVGPEGVAYSNYRDGDIYSKGAVVLHMLRRTIEEDSVFFDILHTFATRHRDTCARTGDFIALVNSKTGEDYQWFFDQYVYRREVPEFRYCLVPINAGDCKLYYRWNPAKTNTDFKLPVRIKVRNKTHRIVPSCEVQSMVLSGSNVYSTTIDLEDYVVVKPVKYRDL